MIDAIDERQIERIEEEKSVARMLAAPEVRRSMRYAAWGLIGMVLLLATDINLDLSREASRAAADSAVNKRAQTVQQRMLGMTAPQPAAGENRSIAVEPVRREKEPCRPYLAAEADYVNVFRVFDLKQGCEVGDLIFADDRGQTHILRDASDVFSKYFVMHRTPEGWSKIITIRICTHDRAALVKGVFYEAVGLLEMGEKIVLSNGDMLAFNAASLNRYKNEHP
jgi:hypothetical protein